MDLIFRQSHWALTKKPLQSRATNPGKTVNHFMGLLGTVDHTSLPLPPMVTSRFWKFQMENFTSY